MRTTLVLLALLVAAPSALAHVEEYAQTATLQAGPYLIFFEPRPTPPFAEATVSMVAQFSDANTGSLIRSVDSLVLVGGPGGFNERKTMAPDGTGYHVASMVLPERGVYSARIVIRDTAANQSYSADAEFEVYPDIPYRIRAVDQAADVTTGAVTPLAFEIVDSTTLARTDALTDLTVNVEHWSEDHTQKLGESAAIAKKVTPGVWRIDHVFPQTGMYHMRFASGGGGFNYADVPLLHVYATAPVEPIEPDGNGTPFPAALALALVAVVALLRKR